MPAVKKFAGQSLYDRLLAYGREDYAAFHMPGHKRRTEEPFLPEGMPWELDITEIDGFDNLHHAEGILKESMDCAAAFYGARKTLYSVNGSTAGILSAIFAAAKPGDTILMGRNCHRSVYHGVFLRRLHPLYLYPQIDPETGIDCGYRSEDLENLLIKHPQIRAVVVTSPTYEGVISDIEAMAESVHRRGIPLIVDEAHGAHLTAPAEAQGSAGPVFPPSAVCLGADLVIQSVHKTLPSLTQTALLHVCAGAPDGLMEEAVRYMSMLQTSSPSYVLLASIDACLRFLASEEGADRRRRYGKDLRALRRELKSLQSIRLLEPAAGRAGEGIRQDDSKLVLRADSLSGPELYHCLRERYHLQPEMCTRDYVLLMTGMLDTGEMYERLVRALREIDREPAKRRHAETERLFQREELCSFTGSMIFTPSETEGQPQREVKLWDSAGFVSAEYAYLYPPGIPLLVPGEEIPEDALGFLRRAKEAGLEIQGLRDKAGERIRVIETTALF